jgi:RNA polymerase sigma-70 factor, ECF subfamily
LPAWNWEALRGHCYREARRVARSRAEADDITQEALVRAWRMRHTCRNPDRPLAWVREITRNEAHRMLSRRYMTHELPTGGRDEATTESPEEDTLMRIDVERALDDLPAKDRLLVQLRYQRDFTHPRVARTMGLSVSNVKVRLHRVRAKLQHTLPTP